jgi:hypothetical protein
MEETALLIFGKDEEIEYEISQLFIGRGFRFVNEHCNLFRGHRQTTDHRRLYDDTGGKSGIRNSHGKIH